MNFDLSLLYEKGGAMTAIQLKRMFAIAILCSVVSESNHARHSQDPSTVAVGFDTAYIPGGFDSNDQVQFVAEGLFQNSCYRHANTKVEVDHKSRKIHIGPVAYRYNGICLQVIVPFDRTIEVGILPPGSYEVTQGQPETKLGQLEVRHALTDDPDDYLYAPISQAFFRNKGTRSQVFLTGEFANSCLRLKDVQVQIEPKVIVLLPVSVIESLADCKDGRFKFERLVEFDAPAEGRYLLHIRSMNGKAVNSLVDVIP